jgi:hypothetical protein
MRILDRLPVGDQPVVLSVGAEAVMIKRYQIAAWASLNDATRPFPIVIDTGHNHNFSITEALLRRWAGLKPDELRFLGTTKLKGDRLNRYRADLRLHRTQPGSIDLRDGHFLMTLDEGISIVPEGTIRLPLLGLRAIVRNSLRLVVDGKRQHVTLKTGWF